MSFVLFIVEDPDSRNGSTAQRQDRFDRMMRFTVDLERRGLHLASESLRSLKDRVRVQNRGGKRLLLDGPFAEAKEVVGGFFLLSCATKDEAVAIAAECPAAEWASVEVREVGPCTSVD
jgi:hypothetical protein